MVKYRTVIESEVRPTGVQLKRKAKLPTVSWLTIKHAVCCNQISLLFLSVTSRADYPIHHIACSACCISDWVYEMLPEVSLTWSLTICWHFSHLSWHVWLVGFRALLVLLWTRVSHYVPVSYEGYNGKLFINFFHSF